MESATCRPDTVAIVPTYNRAALLADCLSSLLAQTRPLREIIVVDDGSTDDTAAVVARMPGPIRYLRQDNQGKSAALNLAMPHATGAYVWICDDDDLAQPDANEWLAGALDTSSSSIAYGRYRVFSTDPAASRPPQLWPAVHATDTLRAFLEDVFFYQFATLVRRECYAAVGPFRTDLLRSQDCEMLIRLLRRFPAQFVDATIFLQRDHPAPRGPGRERIALRDLAAKWVAYDQRIFAQLRHEMTLDEFLPRPLHHLSGAARTRAALLERGCIFARRQMWAEAFADFAAAVTLAETTLPSAEELDIAARVMTGRHGCSDLFRQPGLSVRFVASFGTTAYGKALLRQARQAYLMQGVANLLEGRLRPGLGHLRIWLAIGAQARAPVAAGTAVGLR